ncbi:receptor-type tyrosine-protein phosphatase F-like [Physella acuta]|uniref:receptor-type tyrosine-protein phosphatase F-like n=1 Tax=Physella acuta TaxID=109671 RepID=UPI0027DB146F|nr:receptor-type tyrosine-protein phosphatase F-like [Physella acuta]
MEYSHFLVAILTTCLSVFGNTEYTRRVPKSPTKLRSTDVTSSSITIEWDHDTSNDPVLSYIIHHQDENTSHTIHGIFAQMYQFKFLPQSSKHIFYVVAKNEVGRSRPSESLEVTTKKRGPPKISLVPKVARVLDNSKVIFFCETSGYPSNKYFRRNGIQSPERISVLALTDCKSMLQIDPVKAKTDNTNYTCFADYTVFTLKAEATLKIYRNDKEIPKGFPKFDVHPGTMHVDYLANITLNCVASGDPKPKITWLKTYQLLKSDDRYVISDTGETIMFQADHYNLGSYLCIAENTFGIAYSKAVWVYLKDGQLPPKFKKVPEDMIIAAGDDVRLECSAYGWPRPTLKWMQMYGLIRNVYRTETKSIVLYLINVTSSENYTCQASSDLGIVAHTVNVYVKGEKVIPEFVVVPSDVSIGPGGDVNLTCEAAGPTMPFVRWMDGAVELTGNDDLPLGFSVLTLIDVMTSANYTCEAFLDHGKITHLVQVIVKADETVPQTPSGFRIVKIDDTSVALTWDSQDANCSYIVEYHVGSRGDDSRYNLSKSGIYKTSLTITDLKPNTNYTFRVVAVNVMGRSWPSHPIQVKTGKKVNSERTILISSTIVGAVLLILAISSAYLLIGLKGFDRINNRNK